MGLTTNLAGLMVMEAARVLAGETAMTCSFPPNADDKGPTIAVSVTPMPSLRDLPGLYRVRLDVNRTLQMQGTVERVTKSDLDAVVLRGASDRQFHYAIGLHRSGEAVLSIQAPVDLPPASRPGHCIGHDKPMRHWTPDRTP